MPLAKAAFALVLVAVALSGCFSGKDSTPSGPSSTSSPDASTSPGLGGCSLLTRGVPSRVTANETFSVDVQVECGFQWESQHVAAHFAAARSPSATLAAYPEACAVHAEAAAGPHEAVECTVAEAGTFYLRGHAQVVNGGQTQDLWSQEFVVVSGPAEDPAVGAPSVRTFDVPSTAQAGMPFSFNVAIEWGSVLGATSDHMGAHHWTTPQSDPQVAGAGSCSHVTESRTLPQDITTSCTGAQAGTLYVRGHARIMNGGTLQDYWAPEVPVAVQ